MNPRAEVLLWAQRIIGTAGAPPHQLLQVSDEADLDEVTAAFHKIARMAHPDLHRTMLSPEELETVTTAYSRVAGAYQELRSQRKTTTKMRPLRDEVDPQTLRGVAPFVRPETPATPPHGMPALTRPRTETHKAPPVETRRPIDAHVVPESQQPGSATATAATTMTSKALVFYRKAELCLRRGALRDAMLQIKMAIAADPHSAFLRTALIEVELEVRKSLP